MIKSIIETFICAQEPSKTEQEPEKDEDIEIIETSQKAKVSSTKVDDYLSRISNFKSSKLSRGTSSFESTRRNLRRFEKVYENKDISFDDYDRKLQTIEDRIQSLSIRGIIHDAFIEPKPVVPGLPYTRSEPKKPSKLPELSDDDWNDTLNQISQFKSDNPVVSNFRVTVTKAELSTLLNSNWLCDSVINLYMQMIHNRSLIPNLNLPRVMIMNTFFFTKFHNDGYRPVMKWTKEKIIFDFDLFIFPVHVKNIHWCLACVDFRKKRISYYDSMGSPNHECLKKVEEYLKNEHLTKLKRELDLSQYQKINTLRDIPQQENGYDCGVFACTIAEHLSRDVELNFSQENIPKIRQRMIYEIFNQTLLTTNTTFEKKRL